MFTQSQLTVSLLICHLCTCLHIQQVMLVQVWLSGNAGQLFIEITVLVSCLYLSLSLDSFIIHNIA